MPPGSQPPPRTYVVEFDKNLHDLTLTTGNGDDTLSMIHTPGTASVTFNAGNGSNLVDLIDQTVTGQKTPLQQAINVTTGTGADQVSIFAADSSQNFDINTGDGDDLVTLDADPSLESHNSYTIGLGTGNDTLQVEGSHFKTQDAFTVDGGDGFDTLLYDAAGHPINPSTPTLPDGNIALNVSSATVNYTNIEAIPGFVGPKDNPGGNYTVREGQSLQLQGNALAATNTEILGISWDLNGDGVYGDAVDTSVAFPVPSGQSVNSRPTLTWAQLNALGLTHDGTYRISMQVTTTSGTFTRSRRCSSIQRPRPSNCPARAAGTSATPIRFSSPPPIRATRSIRPGRSIGVTAPSRRSPAMQQRPHTFTTPWDPTISSPTLPTPKTPEDPQASPSW